MNKIIMLKGLIGLISLLIFLTLGGIIYALVNYNSTPKLLSGSKKAAAAKTTAPAGQKEETPKAYLDLKEGERVQNSHPCADLLCIHIVSDMGGERFVVFDPTEMEIKGFLFDKKAKARR